MGQGKGYKNQKGKKPPSYTCKISVRSLHFIQQNAAVNNTVQKTHLALLIACSITSLSWSASMENSSGIGTATRTPLDNPSNLCVTVRYANRLRLQVR